MSRVTITEFIELTCFSAELVLELLSSGDLPFVKGDSGQLLIDLTETSAGELAVKAAGCDANRSSPEHNLLDDERVAAEVLAALDSILDDALALALEWRRKDADSALSDPGSELMPVSKNS